MTQLTERLDRFEDRLRSMETELFELRRLARAEAQHRSATPAPAREPEPPIWEMFEPAPAAPAPPRPAAQPAPTGRVPGTVPGTGPSRPPREPLDLSVLLGARALAWTGGIVTLLGVIFFFVLAVDRGWIGPTARVTLGAAASAALVGAGVWLRRSYGDTYASVSSVGAGIAGFYATLLAAAALYDLIPAPLALTAAAAIAALGATVALAWGSETLASLGLVGAMLVPGPGRAARRPHRNRYDVRLSRARRGDCCGSAPQLARSAHRIRRRHRAAGDRTRRAQACARAPGRDRILARLRSRPALARAAQQDLVSICEPAHVERGVRRLVGGLPLRRPRTGDRSARRRARLRSHIGRPLPARPRHLRRSCGRSR